MDEKMRTCRLLLAGAMVGSDAETRARAREDLNVILAALLVADEAYGLEDVLHPDMELLVRACVSDDVPNIIHAVLCVSAVTQAETPELDRAIEQLRVAIDARLSLSDVV